MATNTIIDSAYQKVVQRNAGELEFHQAVKEVLDTLGPVFDRHPEYVRAGILERFVEPERQLIFRVPWQDDQGQCQVNRGFRVQFNSALGPFKGGLRFHPSVYLGIIKFLAFEQTLKNALTGFTMGGGEGGSDFDYKGRSDGEIMRFCQSFMVELQRHIGPDTDIPAGDIGVGTREIGYLFGQYKRMRNEFTGALTGKGLDWGGSLIRTEATGYGLVYMVQEALHAQGKDLNGLTVSVSGSGHVALYAAEKIQQQGGKVVTLSDSSGFIYDPDGIKLDTVKRLKEVQRQRIKVYVATHKKARYYEGCRGVWGVACDIALPCATQNELDENSARTLIQNGCVMVGEGANMPATPEAIQLFHANRILFLPGKAANAGGVVVSGLEMAQNSQRMPWTLEKVDQELRTIMKRIFHDAQQAAQQYDCPGNLVMGANIASFVRVADTMLAQGIV